MDFINGISNSMFPARIITASSSSPSYLEIPVEKPLTNQSFIKKTDTRIGASIRSGASHSSARRNFALPFSFFRYSVSFLTVSTSH